MRVSTIFATALVLFASGAAACTSDNDCPRGQVCKFLGVKDSRGQCYSRGEGPPTPSVKQKSPSPGKGRSVSPGKKRSIDFEEFVIARREYLDFLAERTYEDEEWY